MVQIKTDNDFYKDKVMLRANHLPHGDLRVLDCFAGKGVIWRGVQYCTGRRISVLPIDSRFDVFSVLHGDNVDYLYSLDLSRFNIIDLDAYGIPYRQLKALFTRGYSGTVFVTFIQTAMGGIPFGLLEEIGFNSAMVKKTPVLFFKRGWDYFKQWLAENGVTQITHRSYNRKHYLVMLLNS